MGDSWTLVEDTLHKRLRRVYVKYLDGDIVRPTPFICEVNQFSDRTIRSILEHNPANLIVFDMVDQPVRAEQE